MEEDAHNELERGLVVLGAEELTRFLVRLAQTDVGLRDRIEGLALQSDRPALGKALRRRLGSFKRGRRFISYRESFGFAGILDSWLDDVDEGLLKAAPEIAVDLLGAFIEPDERIFARVDDSGGSVGMVFSRACGLWSRAMGKLRPSFDRVDRVYELHASNDYGVRDSLLDHASQMLDELEMRRLARRYEDDLRAALGARKDSPLRSSDFYSAGAAMGQVACALGDAQLYERSVRIGSPEPNDLQRERIAEEYLRCGSPKRAIEWLEGCRSEQRDLLALAYQKLGDGERLREVRKRSFEQTLEPEHLASYLEPPDESDRPAARQRAVRLAASHSRLTVAARLLSALDDPGRAEALLLERRAELAD